MGRKAALISNRDKVAFVKAGLSCESCDQEGWGDDLRRKDDAGRNAAMRKICAASGFEQLKMACFYDK